ncbi:MAG: hypothetical protein ABR538_03405 [Candidatus Binatia bacterium]
MFGCRPFSRTGAARRMVVFWPGIFLTTAGGDGTAAGRGGDLGGDFAGLAGASARGGALRADGMEISPIVLTAGLGHSSATTPARVATAIRM